MPADVKTGLPNHFYFPFDTLEGSAALPNRFKPTANQDVEPSSSASLPDLTLGLDPPSSRIQVPASSEASDVSHKIDLKSALQYGTAQGYPPLYSFLHQFTLKNLHPNIPYKGGPGIILTCGNTDGLCKTLEALSNVWNELKDVAEHREGILVEEFVYMNAVQSASPRGLNIVSVALDDEGMKANGKDGLGDVLENWDFSIGKRPHLLYTVT